MQSSQIAGTVRFPTVGHTRGTTQRVDIHVAQLLSMKMPQLKKKDTDVGRLEKTGTYTDRRCSLMSVMSLLFRVRITR
jgi:hypothetical protein